MRLVLESMGTVVTVVSVVTIATAAAVRTALGLWTRISTHPGRMAVATSGVQERGEHVWRLASESTFTQVTVAGADIETADVLATAILSGGIATLQLAQKAYDIDVLAHASDGTVWASPVFTARSAAAPSRTD